MLTIFYLYKVLCSICGNDDGNYKVVNCLQFFIFTRFFAVILERETKSIALWIAYNFLSLQGSLQSWKCDTICISCCELLTIFYLYKVLCSATFKAFSDFLLWIAYNFLSLQGSLQYRYGCWHCGLCCELLTIFYLYKVLCSTSSDV